MLGICVFKDQRDPNRLIRSLEVYVPKVASVPVALPVLRGVLTVILIYLKEVKAHLIANYAGVATTAKANKYWFLALVVCIAHLEPLILHSMLTRVTMHHWDQINNINALVALIMI